MCRWLAYTGSPILFTQVLDTRSTRSSTKACTPGSGPRRPTAADSASAGMTPRPSAGVFRSIEPTWNDQNLRELAGHCGQGNSNTDRAVGQIRIGRIQTPERWPRHRNGPGLHPRRSSDRRCP